MGAVARTDKELTDAKNQVSRASRIRNALEAHLAPTALEIIDESGRHAGHAGARPEGETHFRVRATSAAFAGLSRVKRHQLVHDALKEEFARGLHALALELRAPEESG